MAPAAPTETRSGDATGPGSGVLVAIGAIAGLLALATGAALLFAMTAAEPAPGPGYEVLDDVTAAATVERATAIGAELDTWWGGQFPRHAAGAFTPVAARLTDGDDGVLCDGEAVVPDDDLLDNAWAALCREGPVVAFDPATFRGSDVALQVILAHEWGHVVQALDPALDELAVDPTATDAESELQADCYAGAWAATGMSVDERELAVGELRAIGDGPEVPQDDPDGHGTPDERAAAFRLGVTGGTAACLPTDFDAR